MDYVSAYPALETKTGSQKHLLLVEDEPIIALAESKMLQKAGYQCSIAYTGEQAIEMVKGGERIDLILMDINLGPGMDGTEAAQRILAEKDLPLVFLSCHTDPQIVNKTEGITSYGYIVKTSGETVILASIRMAFRLWEARQEIVYASTVFQALAGMGSETGEGIFQYLVRQVAILFQSRYAFISLIDPEQPTMAKTVAVWAGKGYGENFTYDLRGSPCAEALEHGECYVEKDAELKFPEDHLLKEIGITSYWGTRILDEKGEALGVLAAADSKPMKAHPWSQEILKVVSHRARAELNRLRAERAVLEREKALQSLIESIPLPIFYKDREGRYMGVNEAFCQFIRKTKDQIVGKTVRDIAPPALAKMYEKMDEVLFQKLIPQAYDSEVVDGEGSVHTVRFYKAPFFDGQGRVVGLVGIAMEMPVREP